MGKKKLTKINVKLYRKVYSNYFDIFIYIYISRALGKKNTCVANTFKGTLKAAPPLRRQIESCVTKVPAETTSHVKCETSRQHGFKISEMHIRKNGNIQRDKRERRENENEQTDRCLTNIVQCGGGVVVFSLLTST